MGWKRKKVQTPGSGSSRFLLEIEKSGLFDLSEVDDGDGGGKVYITGSDSVRMGMEHLSAIADACVASKAVGLYAQSPGLVVKFRESGK